MAAAGIAVSVTMGVMKPVLEKLAILMGDKYKKIKGLRKEVNFLREELSAMNDLLEKMDAADKLDPQAKSWRKDIIDMSYDIEDCIDHFMDRVGEAEARDKLGILQKASNCLKTFKDRYRIANQIKKIKTRVIQTSQRRDRYKLDVCISSTTTVDVDPRLSAIYKDSTTLVGIDTQKEELIRLVMDEEQRLKVVSIVGFGGLGKTTLANEVYREVGAQFSCKAFVSISQKPDVTRLLNSVLSQLELPQYSNVYDMDLINHIRKHLADKRYFIIIDDLWDVEPWGTISCVFVTNNQHSRVLITTRNENVAKACSSGYRCIHNMQPLSEEDSRKLFLTRIFGSEDDFPSQFIDISNEILKKCAGLPLAIITVASMLACQPRVLVKQWEKLRNSLATSSPENFSWANMMHILDLSYKSLPHHLKACFLYLGTYPEDHQISKVDLVRQWVAENFVNKPPGQDIWDVAESYFNELVNRSMIQPIYDYISVVSHCKVHDMMLDLISIRCKEDNFISVVHDSRAMAEPSQYLVRRLSVNLRNIEGKIPVALSSGLSHVRCIAMFRTSGWLPPLLDFKFLRVLCIECWMAQTIDLTGICELSLLRYLKVAGDPVILPNKIQRLQHLETLELHSLRSHVPSDIVELPHLSHLILPTGTVLPEGIGKVKLLHTLKEFCVLTSSSESIEGLGELTNLEELRIHNSVGLPRTPRWIAALNSSLGKLSNLKILYVKYSIDGHFCADALSSCAYPPFSKLGELNLSGLTFSRVPRWLGDLCSLRLLLLGVKKILQEDVDMIGTRLPSLVRLGLRIPAFQTDRVVIAGSTGFRVLKFFSLDCDGMSWLTFEAGAMPKLGEIQLELDPGKWDVAVPAGLEHLCSLQKIELLIMRFRRLEEENAAVVQVKSMFQDAVNAHLNRPALQFYQGWPRFKELREDGTSVENELLALN
ncbi:hypothetical protein ACP4OV_018491 [Aristida adscensionis]